MSQRRSDHQGALYHQKARHCSEALKTLALQTSGPSLRYHGGWVRAWAAFARQKIERNERTSWILLIFAMIWLNCWTCQILHTIIAVQGDKAPFPSQWDRWPARYFREFWGAAWTCTVASEVSDCVRRNATSAISKIAFAQLGMLHSQKNIHEVRLPFSATKKFVSIRS